MYGTNLRFFLILPLLFSPQWQLASAEPVQYCRFGDSEDPNQYVNFCVGVVVHQNVSTLSYDFLLSYTHMRYNGSNLGWTAIGLGKYMEGSLMFIVYGDPMSNQAPLVSIRVAAGHQQPTLVTRTDAGGADLKVVEAAWVKPTGVAGDTDGDNHVARVHLICYSCDLWPGSAISATAKSQPWIWAWNPDQDFPVYSFDAPLTMHAHHSTSGGFGNFYVDMARAVNTFPGPVSLPPIRPGVSMLGTSETPAGLRAAVSTITLDLTLYLHALLMGVAFFALFPAGILAMRFGAKKAFRYHWILQLAGSTSVCCGMILGLIMRWKIHTVHQSIGIAVAIAIGFQSFLGWRHHVKFLQMGHRTWLSDSHALLGRLIMVAGWCNALLGMMMCGYSIKAMVIAGLLESLEVVGILLWIWRMSSKETTRRDDTDRMSEPFLEGSKT